MIGLLLLRVAMLNHASSDMIFKPRNESDYANELSTVMTANRLMHSTVKLIDKTREMMMHSNRGSIKL